MEFVSLRTPEEVLRDRAAREAAINKRLDRLERLFGELVMHLGNAVNTYGTINAFMGEHGDEVAKMCKWEKETRRL
jgi:hypothetical protein